jgi:heme exporter protein C
MSSSGRHPAGPSDRKHRPPGGVRARRQFAGGSDTTRSSASAVRYGGGLRALSVATIVVIAVALALVFFWVPLEAEQGFLQKIFYVHVPLAITALCGFVLGGIFAIAYLRTRDSRWDMRSYVAIHMSLIFGVATLITGSIWAKGSWGHWWVWNEPTLVSFLIVFLLYATYQPLRFAIEDPERQSRYAAVFAVTAGAFVPLNFIAVRASSAYLHPRVLGATSNLPWQMALTFLVSLLGIALLFTTLCKYELTVKHTRMQLRALRRLAERREQIAAGVAPAQRPRSAAPGVHATAMSANPAPATSASGNAPRAARPGA